MNADAAANLIAAISPFRRGGPTLILRTGDLLNAAAPVIAAVRARFGSPLTTPHVPLARSAALDRLSWATTHTLPQYNLQ